MTDLETIIRAVTDGWDRSGEYHTACPWCGKPPKRGQTHFSIDFEKGVGFCFVCGSGGSLRTIAQRLGLLDDTLPRRARPHPPRQARRPKPLPAWLRHPQAWLRAAQAVPLRRVVDAWMRYRPTLKPQEIVERGLLLSPLPASRDKAERLIVPLFVAGQLVGLRGRRIGDGRYPRWLSAGGGTSILYLGASLLPARLRRVVHGTGWRGLPAAALARVGDAPPTRDPDGAEGRIVWIVENPIDAILWGRITGDVVVATLSVSAWRDEWTALLRVARPALVIVAYDNDPPGNGGPADYRRAWLAERGLPDDWQGGGVRLVNRLLEAGLDAVLFPWHRWPPKADIGDVIAALYPAAEG